VQQFLAGFIVGVALVAGAVIFVLFRKRLTKSPTNKAGSAEQDLPAEDKSRYPAQVEQLARLVGELAHEIKNPLSTIKINLGLVAEELGSAVSARDGQSTQELDRALRKITVIQKETDRLEQTLGTFLRYFDKTELQLVSLDVNTIMGDMVDFYSAQAHSHSITMRVGLCTEPLVCKLDPDMLKQVILNLFINAQQAMSRGGELIVRTSRQQDWAQIEVSDTGCGIAPDKIAKIFEPYYSSRPDGSGLGLATAKRIIEAHNGDIGVASEHGRGTLFTIKLLLENRS